MPRVLGSWWRQTLVVILFLLIASCSGGGCSSCSSCGVTPIAGGFDPGKTIPNAASVRVTKPGLEFLSTNLPGLASTLLGRTGGSAGVITFNVPTTTTSLVGQTLTICPGGTNTSNTPEICIAEIQIGGALLTINAITPDAISLSGTIPVRIQEINVTGSVPILGNIEIDLGAGSNLSCNTNSGGVSPGATFKPFPIAITLPLVAETIPPRLGYTKIDVAHAAANVSISSSDLIACSTDTGVLGSIVNGLLGALTGTIASSVGSQINSVVLGQLQAQLCTKANGALTPACPIGSVPANDPLLPDGGLPSSEPNCVYASDAGAGACLPIELGLEGHINLGSLLASISPGTSGAVDFVLAGNGNMNPAPNAPADSNGNSPNGITLGMLGGGLASPQSDCVPAAPNPAPTGLVIPDQMLTDHVTGYGSVGDAGADAGPDLGVALDVQFLNYFLGSAYNSGLLCLGVSTDKFQQLNTGLVSFLVPTMKTLTFEQKAAALAITTRPQKPPVMTLGGGTDVNADPLISIALPSFVIDFYVWSEDRYIRGFTFTGDLTVPLNIQSGAAGIQPVLGKIVIANATVTNNVLITDPPDQIAPALSGVLGSIVGQLLGAGIPPINLAGALSSLGLTFTIPPGGIQKIVQTSDAGTTDSYLGLFGNLGTPGHPIAQIETGATLLEKTVHPEAMQIATMRPELAPSLHVAFTSPADATGAPIEYSWQIDQGTFSAWSPDRDVVIRDPMLWMQAKHTLQVVSRIGGVPASQDLTPAVVPFTIDVLPPQVELQRGDLGWTLRAWDVVSPPEALVARTRARDKAGEAGAWSDWQPLSKVAASSALGSSDVEVRDEEGNVGSVSSALIRGGSDPSLPGSGGCSGCTSASRSGSSWPAIGFGLAGIGAIFARRRRGERGLRRLGPSWSTSGGAMLALGSIVTVAATSQGCSCGSAGGVAAGLDASVEGGTAPDGGLAGAPLCGQGCNQPCGPALPHGLIGAYTSIAQAADGTLWVAGYDDAAVDPGNGIDALYGDLVVGKYDTASSTVKWVVVDGLPPPLPDDVCPPNDPTGWRGGMLDSGPDVGLWTSLSLDASGHPMVSYYDATNQALKFASSADGVTWSTHTVFQNAGTDAGRYAKMTIVNGNPVVAYLAIETGTNGYSRTKVSLAHATAPVPKSPSDWQLEDALVDETSPCRAKDCASGQACVISTGTCQAISTGCSAACATGQACISAANTPACTAVAQSADIHPYPAAVGDYINIAPLQNGIGLLVYDRIHGNLLGLTNATGSWAVTILDGETGSRANGTAVNTGDDGVGASLFVAQNGDWHVSYVDGITETLKYLYVPGGTLLNTLAAQMVDDGSRVDGAPFNDGIHIVGDDSNVRQNADGSITITYMDATSGALRLATGSSTPGKWTLHAFVQANRFAGFFPHFVPGNSTIENWWRWADPTTQVISGDVAIVSP
jgi:MYXO-CTERM domain-containing protein